MYLHFVCVTTQAVQINLHKSQIHHILSKLRWISRFDDNEIVWSIQYSNRSNVWKTHGIYDQFQQHHVQQQLNNYFIGFRKNMIWWYGSVYNATNIHLHAKGTLTLVRKKLDKYIHT